MTKRQAPLTVAEILAELRARLGPKGRGGRVRLLLERCERLADHGGVWVFDRAVIDELEPVLARDLKRPAQRPPKSKATAVPA